MKQKTVELLLDCYIEERIPDAVDILRESTQEVPLVKERSHSFAFGPAPPPSHRNNYGGLKTDSVETVPLVKGRSHTFSFTPAFQVQQHVSQNFEASSDVTDSGLEKEQRQRCREIAKKLIKIADEFKARRMASCQDGSMVPLSAECGRAGYTPEEWNTLERIYSGGPSQGVSWIASALTSCLTPQTFQAAIRYVSGQDDDISRQLAVTLELSTQVVNVMGGKVLGTIRDVLTETFQDYTELEDL